MQYREASSKEKAVVAVDLLKQAAVDYVKAHPRHSSSDIGAVLLPHWLDERGWVINAILGHLADEGKLTFTGGGKGRRKIWSIAE